MVTHDRSTSLPRLILGIAVMGIGVVFLLYQLGFDVGRPWGYWPLILVAIGLGKLLESPPGGGRGFGAILVLIGVWLFLEKQDLIDYDIFEFWPVILLLVGGSLIWRAISPRHHPNWPPPPPPGVPFSPESSSGEPSPQPPRDGGADAMIHGVAIMGGVERRSTSSDFRGGDLTAIMGGCKLDLRQASIRTGPAVLDLFAMWGGIEIFVPTDWTVDIGGTPIMGAIEDKTGPLARDPGKVLIIRGSAIMGGVEIKN